MIGLIYAQSNDGVIGDAGTMPWHVPEDLEHFRQATAGRAVLMGRRTWESLPPRFRPLPGRRNLVLSRDPGFTAPGAEVVRSLDEGLHAADEVWVMGGGDVYAQALPHANLVLITHIDSDAPGDVRAPAIDPAAIEWQEWRTSRTGTRYRFGTHRPRG